MERGEKMQTGTLWTVLFPYIVVFVLFYFILIIPQKRREKQVREMLSSLNVGDNIVTHGGIIGKITHIKDDEVSIETALERTKIKIARWAVKSVEKPSEETQ